MTDEASFSRSRSVRQSGSAQRFRVPPSSRDSPGDDVGRRFSLSIELYTPDLSIPSRRMHFLQVRESLTFQMRRPTGERLAARSISQPIRVKACQTRARQPDGSGP
jgi:hypothetical protein